MQASTLGTTPAVTGTSLPATSTTSSPVVPASSPADAVNALQEVRSTLAALSLQENLAAAVNSVRFDAGVIKEDSDVIKDVIRKMV
jgi:hypothetical protein